MTDKQQPQECDGQCEGCSSKTEGCDSNLPKKVDIDVKHVVLILSGKGGVGKSTVSVNLAYALSNHGFKTGLMDLDIHGPSIPKMLGLEEHKLQIMGEKIQPVNVTGTLAVISMAFLLPERSTPVIWRGPMKMAAIQQFLGDVNWGPLDFLVVDLPPGTGDEALSIAQLAPNIAGAIIVTTPQDVSVLDSSKALKFVEQIGIKNLGIIENMSGMVCPHCHEAIDLFGKDGGKKAAEEFGVPFLGSIPLDIEMRKAGDEGKPFIIRRAENPTWQAVDAVMENLIEIIEE
ncbi:MAG: ATPase involved in chromosome partitioning [Methanomicrobiales archaeon 53_19]|jgi:Mrp family chromosome partitioning ATPase|uniref:Mrp/NBP35 family ATP-binding protein n=1 Tax=Methanocalculus sp. TaxID=2004547 RepID=UPI00074740B4|nr:Mrp/NBP35 family ATP-binding protein [Methanocalculus sp.]KUK70786.1 MAG: ATPase involved in chromosome partitioning [Methanocalculus sp. 52_23]KUL04607.1 MAG: ATPase involved in chromosome partitioning [Methanomicrobiales archaeon 53_19]HIJ06828.1 Mrp/NBP35 family ATP-binding protein [Methanocalculus sp.]